MHTVVILVLVIACTLYAWHKEREARRYNAMLAARPKTKRYVTLYASPGYAPPARRKRSVR